MSSIRPPTMTPAAGPRLRRIEQVYVTHCTADDIVPIDSSVGPARWSYGFGVRATSTRDPALLRFAAEFAGFYLPIDMGRNPVDPVHAPRRLSLLQPFDSVMALIHTSYLPKDTSVPPRVGSYFSHVLFFDHVSLAEAAASWASPGWINDYPQGATKDLPPLSAIPQGVVIGDATLATFLGDGPAPDAQDLSTVTFPRRLNDRGERRQLVRRALQWALLAKAGQPSAASKLSILAEPGLVALLLHAVARLLPESCSEGLTFSTFETARSLSNNRHLQGTKLLATYCQNPQAGIPSELLGRRGMILDSSSPSRSSPELDSPSFEPVLELARLGDWDTLAEVHSLMDHGSRSPADSLVEAMRIFPHYQALKLRRATPADLRGLQKSPFGQTILASPSNRGSIWALLFARRREPGLARDFAEIFREPAHLAEFRQVLRSALSAGQVDEWRADWEVLKSSLGSQNEPIEQLVALLSEASASGEARAYGRPARLEILRSWMLAVPGGKPLPSEHAWLLSVGTAEDLKEMNLAKLPATWLGQATASTAPETAAGLLPGSNDGWLAGFAAGVSTRPDAADYLSAIARLGEIAPAWLARLLATPEFNIRPDALEQILVQLETDGPDWETFWQTPGTLPSALAKLPVQGGSFARAIAKILVRSLTALDLVAGSGRSPRLDALTIFRKRMGPRIPAELSIPLDDFATIGDAFAGAGTSPGSARPTVDSMAAVDACTRLSFEPDQLLRLAFDREVAAASPRRLGPAAIRSLGLAIRSFHPTDEAALGAWLDLIETLPPGPPRPEYQVEFIQSEIPARNRQPLLPKFRSRLAPAAISQLYHVATPRSPASSTLQAALPYTEPLDQSIVERVLAYLKSGGLPFKLSLILLLFSSLISLFLAFGWLHDTSLHREGALKTAADLGQTAAKLKKAAAENAELRRQLALATATPAIPAKTLTSRAVPAPPEPRPLTVAGPSKPEPTSPENVGPNPEGLASAKNPLLEALSTDIDKNPEVPPIKTDQRRLPAGDIDTLLTQVNDALNLENREDVRTLLVDKRLRNIEERDPLKRKHLSQRLRFLSAWQEQEITGNIPSNELLDIAPVTYRNSQYLAVINEKAGATDPSTTKVKLYSLGDLARKSTTGSDSIIPSITIPLNFQPSKITPVGGDGQFAVSNKNTIAFSQGNGDQFTTILRLPVRTRYQNNERQFITYDVDLDYLAVDPRTKCLLLTSFRSGFDEKMIKFHERMIKYLNVPGNVLLEPMEAITQLVLVSDPLGEGPGTRRSEVIGVGLIPGGKNLEGKKYSDFFLIVCDDGKASRVIYDRSPPYAPEPTLHDRSGNEPSFNFDISAIAFDGSMVALAFREVISLQEVTYGEFRPIHKISHNKSSPSLIRSVAVTSGGRYFASGGEDGMIRLFDSDTGKMLAEYRAGGIPFRLVFGPGLSYLAAAVSDQPRARTLPAQRVQDATSRIRFWKLPGLEKTQ